MQSGERKILTEIIGFNDADTLAGVVVEEMTMCNSMESLRYMSKGCDYYSDAIVECKTFRFPV